MSERNYIDPKELHEEYGKSRKVGRCTERLGQLFLMLTDHMLRSPRFVGYPMEMKQDLQGLALLKLVKSLDTVNLSFTPRQIFNFATRTAFTAYVTELKKHYKFENTKRALKREWLVNAEFISPRVQQEMIDEIDEFERNLRERSG